MRFLHFNLWIFLAFFFFFSHPQYLPKSVLAPMNTTKTTTTTTKKRHTVEFWWIFLFFLKHYFPKTKLFSQYNEKKLYVY